ncbi:MAG: CDP-alcohol phosphatidyltransferase family protein [Ruminococcaceae bacterium]|nr:CDP-alcohol phosphatidyltransferase family protein [Oscillospiraceae bacterium]
MANIITGSRIAFSLPILFIPISSAWFYVLYLFCGLTDMIDGTIARKTNTVSSFGSKLDTVADFVFMAVCVIKLLPMINIPVWLWISIAVIAIIKVTNVVLGFVRRKKLVVLHTVLNKITGLLLFFLPLSLAFIEPTYSFSAVCIIATIAAIQEGYYTIKVNNK